MIDKPFYVMSEAPGVVLDTSDASAALTVGERAEVSEQLVQALAALHRVDPAAVGLAEFGRPTGYLARQLRRWGEQWQRSRSQELPDMDRLLAGLADTLPHPLR